MTEPDGVECSRTDQASEYVSAVLLVRSKISRNSRNNNEQQLRSVTTGYVLAMHMLAMSIKFPCKCTCLQTHVRKYVCVQQTRMRVHMKSSVPTLSSVARDMTVSCLSLSCCCSLRGGSLASCSAVRCNNQ